MTTPSNRDSRRSVTNVAFVNPIEFNQFVEDATHIDVFADDVQLTSGVHYTVSGVLTLSCEVTITPAGIALAPDNWTVVHNPPLNQNTSLALGGIFGQAFEAALDALTRRMQALGTTLSRAVTRHPGDVDSDPLILPLPEDNMLIGWDDAGQLENRPSESASVAAAEAAAALAAEILGDVREIYLGAFASDAAVNAAFPIKIVGATYFNTTSSTVRTWTGVAWSEPTPALESVTDAMLQTGQKVYNRVVDRNSVTDYAGATAAAKANALWSGVKAASPQSSEMYWPRGYYQINEAISIDRINDTAGNRIGIAGMGMGTTIIMTANPNVNIFELSGTGSYSVSIEGFRFGVSPQGDNVNSAVIAAKFGAITTTNTSITNGQTACTVTDGTGIVPGMLVTAGAGIDTNTYVVSRVGTAVVLSKPATATNAAASVTFSNRFTVLDFQYGHMYVNGMPRGITGPHVSGIIHNMLFDFMTDFCIQSPSKDFRKIEIVANHFYKGKDAGIKIVGSATTSGGSTTQGQRDDANAAGHVAIVGNGFDRYMDTSVQQKMIDWDTGDNIAVVGNWFNGKTPGETDTGSHDAVSLFDVDNAALVGDTAYYFDRGYYFDTCDDLQLGLNIRKGNLLASATTAGAVTLTNCNRANGRLIVEESGGAGVVLIGVNDSILDIVVNASGYSGVYMSNCKRNTIRVHVRDANQLDSANANEHAGIILTGGVGTESTDNDIEVVGVLSSASQGQRYHVILGTNTQNNVIRGGSIGAPRTSFGRFLDNGTGNKFVNAKGVVTENSGEATILLTTTSIVVNHGLDRTPLAHQIAVTRRTVGTGTTQFFVGSVNSTTFTITTNAAPTGADAVFAWQARTN